MESIEKLRSLERSNLPFCAFSFPDSDKVNILVQRDEDFESEKPEGIIMAPFEVTEACPVIYLRPDYLGDIEDLDLFHFEYIHFEDSGYLTAATTPAWKEQYLESCTDLISRLSAGDADKAVLSIMDARPFNRSYSEIFLQAVADYKKAFVYFLHAPGTFTGVGASPELLLERNEGTSRTMSLAGTRRKGEGAWTEKEKEEQDIVTQYILRQLVDKEIENIEYSDPYDDEAGPLVHLRSDIHFTTSLPDKEVLAALHPTPAVCGQPMKEALALIKEYETHDRRYYSGYIGLNGLNVSRYYVNLRCLEKMDYYALCYAGSGITSASDPEAEWTEIMNKLLVMGRFLPVYNE